MVFENQQVSIQSADKEILYADFTNTHQPSSTFFHWSCIGGGLTHPGQKDYGFENQQVPIQSASQKYQTLTRSMLTSLHQPFFIGVELEFLESEKLVCICDLVNSLNLGLLDRYTLVLQTISSIFFELLWSQESEKLVCILPMCACTH